MDSRQPLAPRVRAIEHTSPSSADVVHVEWMLGNTCTYACSYCPAKLHDASLPWLDHDSVLRFIEALHRHYLALGKSVWLQFTGGEPTLYPKFLPLIAACSGRGFRQSVISNGVRTLRFWREAAPYLDYVILTFHIEFADPAHFFAVVDQLRQHVAIHVNVTMLPECFDECYSTAKELRDKFDDITITMKPLRVDFAHELYDYTDEQMDKLRRQLGRPPPAERVTPRSTMTKVFEDGTRTRQAATRFIVNQENYWQGWRCAAGLESLRIMADGAVFRSVCRVGGSLGTIEGSVQLPHDDVECDRERCSCISDILLSKYRT